jgi:hypothetical protein
LEWFLIMAASVFVHLCAAILTKKCARAEAIFKCKLKRSCAATCVYHMQIAAENRMKSKNTTVEVAAAAVAKQSVAKDGSEKG